MIRAALAFLIMVSGALGAGVTEERVVSTGVKFRVVRLTPERVQVVWKDEAGQPYRSFDRVQAVFAKQGKTVSFIMNAGIFEPGGIPSGLHIQEGKQARPVNLADAPGNFFLKPNGVCTLSDKPFIGTPEAWKKQSTGKERWGIQSGPLLLINGKRHPAFREGSDSKLIRNGVGIDNKGQLVFAITDKGELVNLWDFAGLFLQLGCQNALFLDGDISWMVVNPTKPVESNLFGAMFVVAE
ncbi:MAG: hypothetical protein EOP88_08105 [Verrucomicrobiaceae bacterium]|nr:MAG: hypothetical protein EOP88_08105 [Verrucomicrobiaceae bacterium]